MLPAYGETITVQNPTETTDTYQNRTLSFSDPDETTVRAHVQPASTSKQRGSRDRTQVVTSFRFYVDSGTPVTARSRVLWAGRTLDVDGEPEVWSPPFLPGHVEFVGVVSDA